MHIAIISDGVHPYVIGGMQRHTYYLCKYLSRNGVKVTLVHFNRSNLEIDKLEIFSEDERKNIESIVIPFPSTDGWPGHYVRASYKYSCIIFDRLKERWNEFDFIYSKGFSAWKLIEEKEKHNENFPPIAVKFHGYEMFQKQANLTSLLKSFVLRRPVRWISVHADYVFSYGSKITSIISALGVKKERIIELPAGIESSWIRDKEPIAGNEKVFTFLGRYERRKGIEELNKVLIELLKTRSDFRFNFIGPFEEEQQIKSEKFIYHGAVTDNSRLKDILDSSDFLVCPSWSEGMPNVILEAMARGNAILASDVGAVNVMVGSENGFLLSPGNMKQLRGAIDKALEMDNSKLIQMKTASLKKVKERFQYDSIIKAFILKIKSIQKTK